MKTEIVKINKKQIEKYSKEMQHAGDLIKKGELVAFPTETVYGLGGDALAPDAAKKIYAAKGRPSDNPLIVHIADIEDVKKVAKEIPEGLPELAEAFWPGPLTIIVEKSEAVPYATTGGMDTVAIRMPNDEIALELIRKSGCLIAAPSANTSGRPSPTKASHVAEDMDGIIEMIYALDKVAPGTANDDTLLYGVEVKFYNMEVAVDENLQSCHDGLYIIGDGSGITHSLSHASASGVYAARQIAEKM